MLGSAQTRQGAALHPPGEKPPLDPAFRFASCACSLRRGGEVGHPPGTPKAAYPGGQPSPKTAISRNKT